MIIILRYHQNNILDRWMDGQTGMDGCMDGWTDGQTGGWMDRQILVGGWMDGWVDGWMDRWTERTDTFRWGWTDKFM